MTDPLVTSLGQAAIPEAVVVLQAFQQFVTNINLSDLPTVGARIPGALQVFAGTVELQAPALISAEVGTLATDVNSKVAGWISSLQAKLAAAAAPAAKA